MIDPTAPAQTKPQMQPLSPIARSTLFATLALLLLALAFGGWGFWKVFGDAVRPADIERSCSDQQAQDRPTRTTRRHAGPFRPDQPRCQPRPAEHAGRTRRGDRRPARRRGLLRALRRRHRRSAAAWPCTSCTCSRRRAKPGTSPPRSPRTSTAARSTAGRLTVSVEGTRAGKLQRLAWADLRQQPNAPGVEYSFKYFQQVEGDLVLPAGFQAAASPCAWSRSSAPDGTVLHLGRFAGRRGGHPGP